MPQPPKSETLRMCSRVINVEWNPPSPVTPFGHFVPPAQQLVISLRSRRLFLVQDRSSQDILNR